MRGGGERLADWIPAFVVCLVGLLFGGSTGVLTSLAPLHVARSSFVVRVVPIWAFSATPLPPVVSLRWGVTESKKD